MSNNKYLNMFGIQCDIRHGGANKVKKKKVHTVKVLSLILYFI